MAEGPWRCSQCGTINEPVANSCRTCGKWPSLFDLQDSIVDEAELEGYQPRADEEPQVYVPETVEPRPFEPPPPPVPFEPEVEPFEPEAEGAPEGGRRARWTSFVVPIALLVYFAVSYFFSDR
jgi:hypothetical protein